DRERAPVRLVPGQCEGDPCGGEILALAGEGDVGAFAQPDRLAELASPPGCLTEDLEVLGAQACLIELLVRLERLPPRLARCRLACECQRIVDCLRHGHIVPFGRKDKKRGPANRPSRGNTGPEGLDYIIPPMSGIPAPAPAGVFSGGSATIASVVRMFFA